MRMLPLAALPLLLAACATVSGVTATRTVSFEKKSWGNLLHRWTIDSSGRVDHVRDETPFGRDQRPGYQRRVALLTAAQRREVEAAIDRISFQRARPDEECKSRMTDGPYGKLAWSRGAASAAFDWNANCVEGRDADVTAAISALDKIVDDAAMATPVVEILPEESGGKGR